ncbi:MAG: hypothetical protein IJ167_00315 [Lachnospiraceae bacterium]|nr:hypothetical protein [Lachnospiraceae bacterium]
MIEMDIKDYFKKNRKCVISGITAAALIAGSCFAGTALRPVDTFNFEQEAILAENAEAESETITADSVANELTSKFGIEQKNVNKDETVYAFADADGSVNNIVVSEWLRNTDKKSEIKDKSNLKDIENVKGDEAFSQNGDEITWQANGNDIYYQGTTNQELPVSVKVTYYLDGKETKAEDMAGVSGNVKIRFDYTNNTSVEKEINGKKEDIKIPFVAISGLILNENCTNVVVENGRTMPQGASTIVIGYGVPGIKDSLGLEDSDLSEDLSLPDYFEVSADVTDFSLDMTMTAVVSASEFSFGGDLDMSDLDSMIDEMSDAGDALADGSKQLADGTATLLEKMGEFTTGAKQLADGAGQVKNGVDTLVTSSDSLAKGITTINQSAAGISQGLTTLDTALNTPMSDAQKQTVSDQAQAAAVQAVNTQFAEGTDTYNYIYNQAVTTFKANLTDETTVQVMTAQVAAGIKSSDELAELQNALYTAGTVQAYQGAVAQYQAAGAPVPDYATFVANLTEEQKAQIMAGVSAQLNAVADTLASEITTQITSGIAEAGADATGKSVVAACQSAASQAAGQAAGQAAVAGAEGTKTEIAGQIEAVGPTGYSLVSGAQALAYGTNVINSKMPDLTSGIGQLSDGANQLANGSSELASGSEQLQDGVKQLADGASELNDGMNQFNNEAIKKIVEAYNGDIKDIAGRLDAVLEASSEYQTFTEINDGDSGVTKFIIKTNGITE